MHLFGQRGRETVDVDLGRIPSFRLQKDRVARLVGELDDLVFHGRAVARSDADDPSGVHRADVEVGADQVVDALVRARQPAERLAGGQPDGPERERNGWIVAALRLAEIVVDGVARDARRRSGLEPSERESGPRERRGEADRGRFADAASLRPPLPGVHETGRHDDGPGVEARPASRDDSRDPTSVVDEILRHAFDELEVRRFGEGLRSEPRVERLVALCPRTPHRRAARAIEDLELDPRGVGEAPHQAAERVDLPDELPLREAADRRVARHPRDRREISGEERGRPTHAGRRVGRFAAGVTGAHDDHVERRRAVHFPMQKVEKIRRSTSSEVVSPKTSASAASPESTWVAAYSGETPLASEATA